MLAYEGDPYHAENILIHEFAHNIHLVGLATVDPKFDDRLKEAYQQAMKEGLWEGKYASTNRAGLPGTSISAAASKICGASRESTCSHCCVP